MVQISFQKLYRESKIKNVFKMAVIQYLCILGVNCRHSSAQQCFVVKQRLCLKNDSWLQFFNHLLSNQCKKCLGQLHKAREHVFQRQQKKYVNSCKTSAKFCYSQPHFYESEHFIYCRRGSKQSRLCTFQVCLNISNLGNVYLQKESLIDVLRHSIICNADVYIHTYVQL